MTLAELFHLLRKHMRLVIALPVALAVLVAIVSFFMPDQYTASTTMYVLSRAEEGQQATNMATDLNASQMLTNDVAKILKSDRVSRDVADQLGLRDLGDYDISVDNTSTTRVVTLSVTGTDPVMTAQVANAFDVETPCLVRASADDGAGEDLVDRLLVHSVMLAQ